MLPSSGISEKVGSVGRKIIFFLIIFLKSTQKGQIWVHISSFFSKNIQSEQNWVLSRPNFFLFLFLNRVGRWGRHNIFFSWPNLHLLGGVGMLLSVVFHCNRWAPFKATLPPRVSSVMSVISKVLNRSYIVNENSWEYFFKYRGVDPGGIYPPKVEQIWPIFVIFSLFLANFGHHPSQYWLSI